MRSLQTKNIYFWIGLVGVILTAMGVSPETLTTWDILFKNIIELFKNPYMLGTVVMAIIGVFANTKK